MPQKAIAAGGTSALAGAVVTVMIGLLGHPVAPDVEAGLVTIVAAVLSGVATYFTKFEGTN